MSFTLIIPVFNGAKYLANTFLELDLFYKEGGGFLEKIIFIDDGSSDDSRDKLILLAQKFAHLPVKILNNNQNKGKGFAISQALKESNIQSALVGFTDVDLPYGLVELALVKEKLTTCDMVVGNRLLVNEARTQYSFYRYIFSRCFRLLLPWQIRKYKDTQCGFKFFKKAVILNLFSQITTYNWVFDVELFLLAEKNNYKICEIPVALRSSRRQAKGGVSIWKHGFTILRDLFRITIGLSKKN